MAVKRISKETESRLVECLEKVAVHVEGGDDPTRALIKVAREEDLGPGLVRLMAQAYNNGRTNAQRKSALDLFDKSASFRLADAEEAVRELYPRHVKTAADLHRAATVSEEYATPPRWLERRVSFEKAAAAVTLVAQAPVLYPHEGGRHAKKAFSLLREAGRELAERRRQLAHTRDKLAAAFGGLRTYFRRVGTTTPVKQAQVNARLLFGRASDVVFKNLVLDDPLLAKTASAPEPLPCQADSSHEPYALIDTCIRLARKCRDLDVGLADFRKQAGDLARQVNDRFVPDKPYHLGSILRPMEKESIVSDFLGETLGGAGRTAGMEAFNSLMPKPIDKVRNDAYLDLTSPEHEARLRNVRSQAVLHDILANDDYLSQEHPEKVVKMYNEITKLSPRAADQPMLMRSLLRRYMQQAAVDPHDIQQQLDIENQIRNRNQPSGEFNQIPSVGSLMTPTGRKE